MVRENASTASSNSDDEWDVVDPTTAAVLKPDAAAAAPEGEPMPEAEATRDRMSFVLVGESVMPGAMRRDAPTALPAEPTAAAAPVMPPPAAGDVPAAATVVASAAPSPVGSAPPEAPLESYPPGSVEAAKAMMARSPPLPGVSPTAAPARSPPPPPAAVFLPPPPPPAPPAAEAQPRATAKQLRSCSSLAGEEATMRAVAQHEAEVERRRIGNEWVAERRRLGDAEARASRENDAAIAARLAAEEERRAAEERARRREEEERRSAEALDIARRRDAAARARGGPHRPPEGEAVEHLAESERRRCDCLGASAGHHRPTCPYREP